MPSLPRFVPLPRHLLADLPKPLAAGLDLALTVPAAAVRIGQQVLTQAVTDGVALLGRGVELGTALIGALPGHDAPADGDEDDAEPFPSYAGLDTSAWGAADDGAADAGAGDDDDEAADDDGGDEPPITIEPGLAAAVADRAAEPATAPTREDLPVDGYDGLSATALRSKVAGLPKADLEKVRDYEAGHAQRVTVLAMLERQIAKA